jgi:hypothetical protein
MSCSSIGTHYLDPVELTSLCYSLLQCGKQKNINQTHDLSVYADFGGGKKK